jgi:hypothetical protein
MGQDSFYCGQGSYAMTVMRHGQADVSLMMD